MSVPGVFGPTFYWGHWLVDGGLSNPTPVSVAKDMGADFVIGVDLTKKITKPVDKKPGVFSTYLDL
jgi:NTE family protein